jgi:ceramide synthetase
MNPEYSSLAIASLSDLKIIIPTAIFTWVFRDVFTRLMKSTVEKHIDAKNFPTEGERKERALVLCKWILDFFYYSFSSVTTYFILKDSDFLPPALLGKGDVNLIRNEKFPELEFNPYLQTMYLVQLGTHVYSFLHQILVRRNDKKFFEYVLHHGMALFLILFSYSTNQLRIGSIVLITHDFSDVFIVLARGYGDFSFKNKKAVNVIYIIAFCIWCYTRLYAFPVHGIYIIFSRRNVIDPKYKDVFSFLTLYLISMLCALVLMHIYWTIFLLKAQFNSFFKNKVKVDYDVRDKKPLKK